MEKNENTKIFSSIVQIFTSSLILISIFNLIFSGKSEEISQYSELFALCGQGISFKALAELLFMSVVISLVRYFWFSDKFFRNMMMVYRITFMIISVFVLAAAFSSIFNWFPIDMWQAWTGFIVSFIISTFIACGTMMILSRNESDKYQKRLEKYKNSKNEEDSNNECN